MPDNTTAHPARAYEGEVRQTIPFHTQLIEQAIDVAFGAVADPRRWLDTGCGPGKLVELVHALDPEADLYCADPSAEMLEIAREKNPGLQADRFVLAGSAELPAIGAFDVITAVQCHHYSDADGRERALRRLFELLAPGGALVTFENVRSETDRGHEIQRRRWSAWMRAQGRTEEQVVTQLGREGTRFFPVRVSEHEALLAKVGFAPIELVWRAYGQAGFLAVRPRG